MEKSKRFRIFERIAVFVGTLLLLYFLFKFATYFMPFLIAGVIAILIEPIIKFCMNRLKLSRRVSSMIIVAITIILIIMAVVYGGSAIIKEILSLSKNIPSAISTATTAINDITKKVEELFPELKATNSGEVVEGDSTLISQISGDFIESSTASDFKISGDSFNSAVLTLNISGDSFNSAVLTLNISGDKNESVDLISQTNDTGINILEIMRNSIVEFIGKIGTLISEWATSAVKLLLSVPTMIINIVITILALIFFTKDRIYVIDMLEHHMPKNWIKKSKEVLSEIFSTIGGYIRVYIKIILITFAELYLAFNIVNFIGLEIKYPLILAILIAIVDVLPVLGVGTVLIPWSIWMFIVGNWGLRSCFVNNIWYNFLH